MINRFAMRKPLLALGFLLTAGGIMAQSKPNTGSKVVTTAPKPSKGGYEITVNLHGWAGKKFFLGYYFGDKQYLRDSAQADKNGKVVFKGDKALEGGIYMMATYEKNLMFDFVVTEQIFTLETDTADFVGAMKVKNSYENEVFFDYTKLTSIKGKEAMRIEGLIKEAREKKDTATERIQTQEYRKITSELADYRKNLMAKHPTTLLSKIFRIMTDIEVPDPPKNEKGIITDSSFQYKYYKAHYFDNFDWADERIVRTPVFHNKFENYITKVTLQSPECIIASSDYVLKQAEAGKENFKYVLYWITNHYETSTYMGHDKVFVHMVDNYYAKGKAFWIDETLLFKMKDRADKLRYNLIGVNGKNLNMIDTNGVYHSLYNMKGKYTLLIFWDANCGKCKEEMPKLVKLYEELNANKKQNFFDVFSVSVTPDANDWVKYLRDKKLKWVNVYDPSNETNFRNFYDIYSTPVLFLMDQNKKIIAKRIGVEQLKDFIQDFESGKIKYTDNCPD